MNTLKEESVGDRTASSNYIENKFVTEDGFRIGYYVDEGKLRWYLRLEKYGSGNSVFVKQFITVQEAFDGAKLKISELQAE